MVESPGSIASTHDEGQREAVRIGAHGGRAHGHVRCTERTPCPPTSRCNYGEVFAIAPGSPIHRAQLEARLPLASWPFAATNDEVLKRLGALPLVSQPGQRWLHHMPMPMPGEILGVHIARVSGKSLGAFTAERIFDPLG